MEHNLRETPPLVSVLLPTFNSGTYLRPALKSILCQTYSRLEIIIIDDGSFDDSIDRIKDSVDDRVRIIRQENRGKSASLNKGFELLNGEYWTVQDADDLSYPNRIEELVVEMSENIHLAATFSGHDLLIDDIQFAPTKSPLTTCQCDALIKNFKMPAHDPTGLYRTSMTKNMRFDTKLKIGEGLDFILRLGEKYPISRIGKCLYSYRIHHESLTRKKPNENTRWVNQAVIKAYSRRRLENGGDVMVLESHLDQDTNTKYHDVVSHCMNSVVDLKMECDLFQAIMVGLKCLRLEPCNYLFYKPMIYSLVPIFFINLYRSIKWKEVTFSHRT